MTFELKKFIVSSPLGDWLGVYQNDKLIFFGSFALGRTPLVEKCQTFLCKHKFLQKFEIIPEVEQDRVKFWITPPKLFMYGTPFQIQVWTALLDIPKSQTWSYSQLSKKLNMLSGIRAIASAVARNPISYWVPCHRVVYKSSSRQAFMWGEGLKIELLRHEKAL